jgi:hypothetical protein
MSDSFGAQRYKQKPRRATAKTRFLKNEQNPPVLQNQTKFFLFLHPYYSKRKLEPENGREQYQHS